MKQLNNPSQRAWTLVLASLGVFMTALDTLVVTTALPVLRIDHFFVSREIVVRDVFAPFDPLTRVASDHLPLVMDFEHHPAGTPAPDGRDLGGRAWSRVRFDIVLAPAGA